MKKVVERKNVKKTRLFCVCQSCIGFLRGMKRKREKKKKGKRQRSKQQDFAKKVPVINV